MSDDDARKTGSRTQDQAPIAADNSGAPQQDTPDGPTGRTDHTVPLPLITPKQGPGTEAPRSGAPTSPRPAPPETKPASGDRRATPPRTKRDLSEVFESQPPTPPIWSPAAKLALGSAVVVIIGVFISFVFLGKSERERYEKRIFKLEQKIAAVGPRSEPTGVPPEAASSIDPNRADARQNANPRPENTLAPQAMQKNSVGTGTPESQPRSPRLENSVAQAPGSASSPTDREQKIIATARGIAVESAATQDESSEKVIATARGIAIGSAATQDGSSDKVQDPAVKVAVGRPQALAAEPTKPAAPNGPQTKQSPTGRTVPEEPSQEQVKTAMEAVSSRVKNCAADGAEGRIVLKIAVKGLTGRVVDVEPVSAGHAGTPTGTCASQAAGLAVFPKFSKTLLVFQYPYDL